MPIICLIYRTIHSMTAAKVIGKQPLPLMLLQIWISCKLNTIYLMFESFMLVEDAFLHMQHYILVLFFLYRLKNVQSLSIPCIYSEPLWLYLQKSTILKVLRSILISLEMTGTLPHLKIYKYTIHRIYYSICFRLFY